MPGIRNLEKDQAAGLVTDCLGDHLDEVGGVLDMLERHLAADEIRRLVHMVAGEELGLEVNRDTLGDLLAPGDEGWVVAGPAVIPMGTEQDQEVAIAATDLDDPLATDVELLDQVPGKLVMEPVEGGREALRGFVAPRVFGESRVEADVADKAAMAAETKINLASRKGFRFRLGCQQQHRYWSAPCRQSRNA